MTDFRRTVFISDTHGYYSAWVALLQNIGLIDADLRWIAGNDVRLVHVGDHTDRGEDSIGLYRLIKGYQTELGRDQIVRLIGNHDLQYLGGPWCGAEAEIRDELAEEMQQDLRDGSLKFAYEFKANDGSWLVVHAGLSGEWSEYHAMPIEQVVEKINAIGAAYPHGPRDEQEIIDGIGRSRGGRGFERGGVTWADYWIDLRTDEDSITHRQIVGHSIQPHGIAPSPSGKFWGVNVHYDHAQALVYDHETGEWEPSALFAPEGSPFLGNATAQIEYHVNSLVMGGFRMHRDELDAIKSQPAALVKGVYEAEDDDLETLMAEAP